MHSKNCNIDIMKMLKGKLHNRKEIEYNRKVIEPKDDCMLNGF